jgi:hypothetical protein
MSVERIQHHRELIQVVHGGTNSLEEAWKVRLIMSSRRSLLMFCGEYLGMMFVLIVVLLILIGPHWILEFCSVLSAQECTEISAFKSPRYAAGHEIDHSY